MQNRSAEKAQQQKDNIIVRGKSVQHIINHEAYFSIFELLKDPKV